jgi:SnoaL-like polyketide cyclase
VERPGLGDVRETPLAGTVVPWPGQPEPTRGRQNHKVESIEFFKTFPDNHLINHPYKVEIAQGDWTCTVADFTGTMRGPMKGADGKMIAPTNKAFSRRILYRSALGERRDRRRKALLRFGWTA